MQLAGLDIGTTGCRVAVYSANGECLGKVNQDYPVQRTTSEHEVDAKAISDAVMSVIKKAAARYREIRGIGVTSFGETVVLLDEMDEPLLPAMLYTDPRGVTECDRIAELVGTQNIIRQTGVSPAPMYSLPKLLWVKENRPEIWRRVKHICLMEDYIVYLLSGTAQIDYSLATRTMAFDIHRICWAEEILDAAGIDKDLLSTPVPTGTSAGSIRRELAAELGLNESTQIVSMIRLRRRLEVVFLMRPAPWTERAQWSALLRYLKTATLWKWHPPVMPLSPI